MVIDIISRVWTALNPILDDAVHVPRDWNETAIKGILREKSGAYFDRNDPSEYPEFMFRNIPDLEIKIGEMLRTNGIEWEITAVNIDETAGETTLSLRKNAVIDYQ